MPEPDQPPEDDADRYVGMSIEDARRRAAEHGWMRVREVDEADPVITLEWITDRISFFVEDGSVARCWFH